MKCSPNVTCYSIQVWIEALLQKATLSLTLGYLDMAILQVSTMQALDIFQFEIMNYLFFHFSFLILLFRWT